MRSLRVLAVVVVVLAPAIATAASAGAVLPQVVGTCNMTISQSVQLANDLSCSGEPALNITTAPGRLMTVDLGGHTMSTTNFSPAIGVQNGGGSVVIKNGHVVGGAVDLGNGSGALTTYEKVTFDGIGVYAIADNTRVYHNWFTHGATVDGNGLTTWDIDHNNFVGSGDAGPAINIAGETATIEKNLISGYETGISLNGANTSVNVFQNDIYGAGTGITVGGTPDSSAITGQLRSNHLEYGRGDAVVLGDGAQTVVLNNLLKLNGGDGLHVVSNGGAAIGVTITNNNAILNVGVGIDASATGPNVTVTDGGSNHAVSNLGGQCLNVAC